MFDPKKPVQTRDGRKARIICTDAKTHKDKPIVYLIDDGNDKETWNTCSALGVAGYRENDLVNIPERTYRYENVYVSTDGKYPTKGGWLDSRERADYASGMNQGNKKRTGVIKYTLEDNVVISVELENA